jgi:hypothetical protein
VIKKIWVAPWFTDILPEGLMLPLEPAVAVMMKLHDFTSIDVVAVLLQPLAAVLEYVTV